MQMMKNTMIMEALSKRKYDQLTVKQRLEYIRRYYSARKGKEKYSTSPDHNLKELEIDFILAHIKGPDILDLGCGNGYTLLRIAEKLKGNLTGVDFSSGMINGAEHLSKTHDAPLKCKPVFLQRDVLTFTPERGMGSVDTVITERFLLNLPARSLQHAVIKRIHSFLRPGGTYIMIEGSKEGLIALNKLRRAAGLKPIPDRGRDNLSSRKFNNTAITVFLKSYFDIIDTKTFDLYYILSRIIYPYFVFPEDPKYTDPMNTIARVLHQHADLDSSGIGHVKGYVLKKRPA